MLRKIKTSGKSRVQAIGQAARENRAQALLPANGNKVEVATEKKSKITTNKNKKKKNEISSGGKKTRGETESSVTSFGRDLAQGLVVGIVSDQGECCRSTLWHLGLYF